MGCTGVYIVAEYGENPLCALENYDAIAIYSLANLRFLDTMILTEEHAKASETIFKRKTLYELHWSAQSCV